jgi:hypothetical protein
MTSKKYFLNKFENVKRSPSGKNGAKKAIQSDSGGQSPAQGKEVD